MNWFGGDSKKEEKKKAKQQQAEEDLAVRQAAHARNQRIKHLSGPAGPGDTNAGQPLKEPERPNQVDIPMKEEIG